MIESREGGERGGERERERRVREPMHTQAVRAKVQTHTLQGKCLIQSCGARCKVVPGECSWSLEENLVRFTHV